MAREHSRGAAAAPERDHGRRDVAERRNTERQPDAPAAGEHRFSVIEGRLDLASRVARVLGTTLLITFIVGLVGALVLHATIIENQRDLDTQRQRIARVASETEEMRSELAELEAPARIVSEAREQGMIEAPSIAYLTAPAGMLDHRTLVVAANDLRGTG